MKTILYYLIITFLCTIGVSVSIALVVAFIADIKHALWLDKMGYKSLRSARDLIDSL